MGNWEVEKNADNAIAEKAADLGDRVQQMINESYLAGFEKGKKEGAEELYSAIVAMPFFDRFQRSAIEEARGKVKDKWTTTSK